MVPTALLQSGNLDGLAARGADQPRTALSLRSPVVADALVVKVNTRARIPNDRQGGMDDDESQ